VSEPLYQLVIVDMNGSGCRSTTKRVTHKSSANLNIT